MSNCVNAVHIPRTHPAGEQSENCAQGVGCRVGVGKKKIREKEIAEETEQPRLQSKQPLQISLSYSRDSLRLMGAAKCSECSAAAAAAGDAVAGAEQCTYIY